MPLLGIVIFNITRLLGTHDLIQRFGNKADVDNHEEAFQHMARYHKL
ncbi:hypothetical protein [Mycobacteroides abscessus]|nr:hypothetical protein [Mycobacteroides abscessus]